MSIWNFTAHPVNIIRGATYNPKIRKFTGGEVVRVIQQNGMLNAKLHDVECGAIDGIPIIKTEIVSCDPLPDRIGPDDVVIVSGLYAQAYTLANGLDKRLYTVKNPVMSEDGGKVIGCMALQPYNQ